LSADYNAWVNARLYDACASLSPADYRADQGAFFRSVHGTLNHLLLGDLLWLGRIQGRVPEFTRLDAEICGDLHALRARGVGGEGAGEAIMLLSCQMSPRHARARAAAIWPCAGIYQAL